MIKSFRHKNLENFFIDGDTTKIDCNHLDKLSRILDRLDKTHSLIDIKFPGSNLHKLEPKSKNRWSIHVNDRWVVTFDFKQGDVYNVDYEDYH